MIPIDVDRIAESRGLRVQRVEQIRPGVFGAFYVDSADAGILISLECFSVFHERFTLAHEIGHFVLDGHVEALIPAGVGLAVSMGGHYRDQQSRIEREADAFASELLMPDHLVSAYLRAHPSMTGIEALAAATQTSMSSAAIRFVEGSVDQVAVALTYSGEVEWYACSASLAEHAWTRKRLKRESIPRGSATARLQASPKARRTSAQSEALLLCEWFRDAPSFVRVHEECVNLGDYGRVLTLLTPIDLPTADELEEEEQRANTVESDWRTALRPYRLD